MKEPANKHVLPDPLRGGMSDQPGRPGNAGHPADPRMPPPGKGPPVGHPGAFEVAAGRDAGEEYLSLLQLRPDGAFRIPDWRARLVWEIVTHPDPRVVDRLRSWGDGRVGELLGLARQGVDPRHPLALARALLEPCRRVLRLEVEARLLAGEASPAIAAATGVDAEVVEWHHAGHFDVRDRLGAAGYIVHTVLGTFPPEVKGNEPPYELLRWDGYFYGPAAITALLEVLGNWEAGGRPTRRGTAAELSRRALRLRVRAKVLARLLPAGGLEPVALRTLLGLAGTTGAGQHRPDRTGATGPALHSARRRTTADGRAGANEPGAAPGR